MKMYDPHETSLYQKLKIEGDSQTKTRVKEGGKAER